MVVGGCYNPYPHLPRWMAWAMMSREDAAANRIMQEERNRKELAIERKKYLRWKTRNGKVTIEEIECHNVP